MKLNIFNEIHCHNSKIILPGLHHDISALKRRPCDHRPSLTLAATYMRLDSVWYMPYQNKFGLEIGTSYVYRRRPFATGLYVMHHLMMMFPVLFRMLRLLVEGLGLSGRQVDLTSMLAYWSTLHIVVQAYFGLL